MRPWLRMAYLALGLALLGWVLARADLAALADQALALGAAGLAAVLAIYLAAFLADSVGWLLALPSLAVDRTWIGRTFVVRMVGEAFNNVTPLASLGGEPVKAVLLKRRYGVGYRESLASLLLARTVNLLALVAFLAGGFWLMLGEPRVDGAYAVLAGAGLAALAAGVAGFFLAQRLRMSSLAGERLARLPGARRLEALLVHLRDLDARLVRFYTADRRRFAAALGLALANWFLGVAELYVVMALLGHPVGFAEAWIIESFAQLVRAGTFFIPASIGAQEGAFLLVVGALTGDGVLGLAVALIRRVRELVWIAAGLALGWALSLRPADLAAPPHVPQQQ